MPAIHPRHIPVGTPERLGVQVHTDSRSASATVAAEIAGLINARAAEGRSVVLGLATGSTPLGVYQELVSLHRSGGLSFKNVTTFNLDEYWPMAPDDLQSYRRFMKENFFDLIDIDQRRTFVPDGTVPIDSVVQACEHYEQQIARAGGIDIQLLGIGRTGHIGFNEPGSPSESRTRLVTLDRVTRTDAASDFFGEANVPRRAITMGIGTILQARRVFMLAFGEHKAAIIRRTVEDEPSKAVAASFLQHHGHAVAVLDRASAAELTRIKTPWLVESVQNWDDQLTRRATIWLARHVRKPITKLTDEDYNEHGLQDLLAARGHGEAYDINIQVFRSLQKTITGWPGGKPQDATAGSVFPKRVVVFSPHPDDDVISMGGTFIRLCDQGHDVHVAYQTSGNIAVWDESAIRHADFVSEFAQAFKDRLGDIGQKAADAIERSVEEFVRKKKAGEVDSPELQRIKTLIRRTEARAGARYSGVKPDNIHFLDLPFYETGRVKKKPIGEEDIKITMDLLERVKPHQVYAAGDLSDPHGTHRVCLAAITTAMHRLAGREWMKQCTLWLYRGAWQEWDPEQIEMAVPLSPDEVMRKRYAISI